MVRRRARLQGFGRLVKAWRVDRGMTQDQLGRLLGVDKFYISRVENEHQTPRIDRADQFAAAFGADLSTFLRGPVR